MTEPTPHPAPFSKSLYEILAQEIKGHNLVLDPFAGIGRIHEIGALAGVETIGIELEPEWADQHPKTIQGNALRLPFPDGMFTCVCTSPCYGNRFADSHNAKDGSSRRTYKHLLGRDLHPDNSGQLQWGPKYREFHEKAWAEVLRVLRPAGKFVLNVSDHIRNGELQLVSAWHSETLMNMGFVLSDVVEVETRRYRHGTNRDARPRAEYVFIFTAR